MGSHTEKVSRRGQLLSVWGAFLGILAAGAGFFVTLRAAAGESPALSKTSFAARLTVLDVAEDGSAFTASYRPGYTLEEESQRIRILLAPKTIIQFEENELDRRGLRVRSSYSETKPFGEIHGERPIAPGTRLSLEYRAAPDVRALEATKIMVHARRE